MKKLVLLLVCLIMVVSFLPISGLKVHAASTSWLETELDGNEAFIDATETALSKNRKDITLSDLETIQTLTTQKTADSIPNKISDYKNLTSLTSVVGTISEVPDSLGELKKLVTLNLNQNNLQTFPMAIFQLPVLENLWINKGNITEIPAEITTLSSHLNNVDFRYHKLTSLPSAIFTTSWDKGNGKKLIMYTTGNQITSDIPAGYLDNYNNGGNMLEYYNNPPSDPYHQKQDQLTYTGGTITVPLNTNFNQVTPDKTKLGLKSGTALFPQHQFIYYDDGTSNNVLTNGVATNTGNGYITIKSSLSTNTNPFAKVRVPITVTAPEKGGDITVQYLSDTGDTLATSETLTGNVGDSYSSSAKTIENYTLTTTPANATGTFTNQTQTVNYVYAKNKVVAAPVTVHYVDTDGKDIAPSETLTGNVGDSYSISPKSINGYVLKKMPSNSSGKFNQNIQQVTFIYTRKMNPAPVVPSSNISTVTKHSGELNQASSTKQEEINKEVLPKTGDQDNVFYLLLGCLLVGLGIVFSKHSSTK
ncbi:LPXTG cell wall anchor domain-containing protein [Listeria monocytogenes]|nr:LPXTG cell wall anchor domain-containing protein [Listeria monocytogenes]